MKVIYFIFVFFFGAISTLSFPVIAQETLTLLEKDQQDYFDKTGEYFSDVLSPDYKVHTYESLCKGFVVEQHYKDKIEYIGYGDKAKDFTYTVNLPIASKSSSSLDVIGL